MAAQAMAERERESRKITAQAQRDTAQMKAKTADIIKEGKGSIQLKYLETLSSIVSDNKSSTVILPNGMLWTPKSH